MKAYSSTQLTDFYFCETQVVIIMNDVTRNCDDDNNKTDIAILDFSKAFDTVPHDFPFT